MRHVNKKDDGGGEGLGMAGLEDAVKDSFQTANEYVQEGYDAAREAVIEAVRPLEWKTVLAVGLGLAAVTGVIVLAFCRPRKTLLQRGLQEGARYATLIPDGWHKAQSRVLNLAHDSARESMRLWNKLPRVRVEIK